MKQSRKLVKIASKFSPISRILTSPYLRTMQTIAPLAASVGLEPELVDALGETKSEEGAIFIHRAVSSAATTGGGTIVVCVHGGIEDALGFDTPFHKGSVWVFRDGDLRRLAKVYEL
jgi:phosphohistidine phosphatase SixA